MSNKFQNKYRIPSARLQNWDYAKNAAYFITICTKNREHFFGEIRDGVMYINDIGKIAENEWIKTLQIRPDMNLELGEFVVMPNHFHAIIIIGENEYNTPDGTDAMHRVSTVTNKFGPQSKNMASIIRGFKSSVTTNAKKLESESGIIACTDAMHRVSIESMAIPGTDAMHCVSANPKSDAMHRVSTPFAWQPRFHDHIIRDTKSFEHIQNYIANNPKNWKGDTFNEKQQK